jgi:hypothetical protein
MVTFDGFVHADRGRVVDGRGRPLLLRGMGLGNWLLPEGYMWRFGRGGPQSCTEIEALVEGLLGAGAASAFWRGFRDRFVAEADIARIATLGFDHVRLPLNARLLIDSGGSLLPDGLEPIDRLIEWCRRHGLWVILDLHAAPGGQTGTHIDDSPRRSPDLFVIGGAYRELTLALWSGLAGRYRDETVIAGYDLLNEPLPYEHGDRYRDDLGVLYRDLTAAIRASDPNHMLIYEGTQWSMNWDVFTEVWDPNSLLQFHKYWSPPDRPSAARYVERGAALGLPIYMGEGGENYPGWLQTAFGMYEDLGISWCFWPWKKMQTWSSPMSVRPPEGWDAIVRYAATEGPAPAPGVAKAVFDALLDRMALESCDERPEIVSALFHRVPIRLAPEAFGFHGDGRSYSTCDAHPLPGFRADDRVTIRLAQGGAGTLSFDHDDSAEGSGPRLEVVLDAGDWVEYAIEVATASRLEIEVSVAEPGTRSRLDIFLDGAPVATEPQGDLVRGTTGGVVDPGPHALRVQGVGPRTAIRSLSVVPAVERRSLA